MPPKTSGILGDIPLNVTKTARTVPEGKVSSAVEHFSKLSQDSTTASKAASVIVLSDENYENTLSLPSSPVSSSEIVNAPIYENSTVSSIASTGTVERWPNQGATRTNSTSSTSKRKTHVGPWRLGRTLGRGSSGRVRLAKHNLTGKLAAVKIVPKSIVFDDNDSNSHRRIRDGAGMPYGIEREVVIMKLIEHPNVMGLYDVWENHGELYLILEYVEGGELFDYLIKRGRLEEFEAVHYFRQIIWGIDYCHKFNICHRDLKPENLLLDKHHNIKIADFGMAALETHDKMLETSCGSPHYASPEIVAGKKYHGPPSDIWSCGVILFALLTGHLPFDDDNIRDLLLKVQAGKFQMPVGLSIQAKDLIWRILRTNPEDRITADDILRHPLMLKYPPQSTPINSLPPIVHQDLISMHEIDFDIVKSLQTLWHDENRDVIVERLLSSD
ncbi:kinase-like domain-containing protein, partial [Dipodascopsis uninucleata]